MSEISKQALKVDNSTSFPNNTTGYISPTILRAFNVNMIDSLVEQSGYTANSASWNVSIGQLNSYTASFAPSLSSLNSFTASQLVVNSNLNLFTQSANASITNLDTFSSSFNAYTSSINQIRSNGVVLGTSTIFNLVGPGTFFSASLVQNIQGNIATLTFTSDNGKVNTSSFNDYTASTAATQSVFSASVATSFSASNATFTAFSASQNNFNLSATASLQELLNLSSSLSGGYATQGELDYSASVLQANIDNLSSSVSSSLNVVDGRINTLSSFTGSYATTGSNTFIGTEIISGSVTMAVTGSGDIDTLRLIPWISSSTYNGGRDTTIIARDRQQTGANASTASFQPAVASPINIVFGAIANNSVQATISGSNNVIPAVRTSAAGLCDFSANRSWIGIMPATRNPRYGGVRIDNSLVAATVTAINNTAGLSASLAQGYEGFGFGDAITLTSTTVNATTTLNPNSCSVLIQNSAINGATTINGNKSDFWPVAAYAAGSGSYTIIGNVSLAGINITITDQSSISASFGGAQFNGGIAGGNVVLTNPIAATSNNNLRNFIVVGNSLTVTGSDASSAISGGSAFFGRNNRLDGIANNTANTIFAVGTGTGQTAATRKTGFLIDTGSNAYFEGSLNVSGSLSYTGSVYGNVSASSITGQTASIDLSVANYFTLTLSGSTNINVLNPRAGVTATLVINTDTGATASFSSNVKQPSGSLYAASPSGNIDIISFTAVDTNTIYAFPAQSFV